MLVLSGGTGTPKLLLGLKELLRPEELSVVVNTAEDLWISGNYISPDIDSVLYTLADMIDEKKWWGIKKDKTITHDTLIAMGIKEKLQVGDMDRAVHIFRSELLRRGVKLSHASQALAESLGVKQRVVPMTDDIVSTVVSTPQGVMHFQEFWVGRQGLPEVCGRHHPHRSQQPCNQHRPHSGLAGRARAAGGQKGGGHEPIHRK
jgi:LPPG:FO 2-phospho-L-lactate transferase